MSAAIELITVDRLRCVVAEHDWAFDRERSAEIDAHWRARLSANPALYDGPVLLAHEVEPVRDADGGDALQVKFFHTRFSRFLAWRDFGFPGEGVQNCFSMPALRSADGAFLLGEMGVGHSAAGAIYFPAGTPDPSDIRDGFVDLEDNLLRELQEETGVARGEVRLEPRWTIALAGPRVACLRIAHCVETAAALERRITAFLAAQEKPELAGVRMAARRADLAEPRLLDFIRRFLEPLLPE
ncbi:MULTISPECIES: NUDIX hydrolase [Methylosinus]|uniref:NUDIX hydrolase n=1 Tax=Methylosinus trichosporium (strain ATCC 35070 / NCIMB 11131 / UNIQEM 75 / OB3b) TaxID=595536 RepID=A0A2D2CY35_METT3|nr:MULTISPECIES: NUDIX hydrolase [Methylosinus]ATQ67626.1 NUDIX hydrolase [Methylosinus trichosporium OB3b]OBS52165.1 NUDIX hydrolase [Methylosinus sp. 3S-1]